MNFNGKKIRIKQVVCAVLAVFAVLIIATACDPNTDGSAAPGNTDSTGQDPVFNLAASSSSGFTAFREGPSCSTADIDGDGDIDVLITGEDPDDNQRKSILYNNAGNGSYTTNDSTLAGVEFGTSAFADVDNDDDMDLCIAGKAGTTTPETSFYINNGSGSFSFNGSANLAEVWLSAMVFGDVDNDGFTDLIISGGSFSSPYQKTSIYINQGIVGEEWQGFTDSGFSTALEQVKSGSLDMADVDSDGYLDLLLTGEKEGYTIITELYMNQGDPASDGWDGFSDSGESFINIKDGEAVFSDIDGDSDEDIILAGATTDFPYRTAVLYRNDGTGGYTLDGESSFEPLSSADIITGDADDDGDIDLIISGYESDSKYYSRFYRNNGSGSFTEEGFGLTNIGSGEGHFFDADSDGDLDLLNCGTDDDNAAYAELYLNDLK